MDTIADRLKIAMNQRDIKQADLVRITGIGKSSISTYLTGAYEPKQKNIYKLAKALNVNEAWLMGNDVPMNKQESINNQTQPKILEYYNKLNNIGKQEAEKRVEELTQIPKYIDEPVLIAAHHDNPTDEQIELIKEDIKSLKKPEN